MYSVNSDLLLKSCFEHAHKMKVFGEFTAKMSFDSLVSKFVTEFCKMVTSSMQKLYETLTLLKKVLRGIVHSPYLSQKV